MSGFRPLVVGVFVVMMIAASASGQQYPPQLPRDGATKLFENDRVVIWDVLYTKGSQPLHEHYVDAVRVTLQAGTRKVTDPDGASRDIVDKFGGATFLPKGIVHKEEGTSDVPTRNIIVWLK